MVAPMSSWSRIWAALSLLMLLVSLTGVGGGGLFDRLAAGPSTIAGTESARGEEIIKTLSGDGQTVTLQVSGIDLSSRATQEAVAAALEPAHTDLRQLAGQTNVLDPFVVPGMLDEPAARDLAATDLSGFLLIVYVDPNESEIADPSDSDYHDELADLVTRVEERLGRVPDELAGVSPAVSGVVSHSDLIAEAINEQVRDDLVRGEVISLSAALVVMVFVFGGFLAAGLPILGALVSIAGSLGVLWSLSLTQDLHSFVINIVTVIGLGLSIDYGLLVTSRYREELTRTARTDSSGDVPAGHARRRRTGRRSPEIQTATRLTLISAGRTVLFSGLVVATSMLSLLLTGTQVLRSIALAGITVVLIAMAAALTLVPAVLVLLGDRMRRTPLLQHVPGLAALQRGMSDVTREEGMFSKLAGLVHRMPWVVLMACLVLLVVLASPIRNLHMLNSSTDLLPASSDQRTYLRILQEGYPKAQSQDATLVIAAAGDPVMTFVNEQVAAVPGVDQVVELATAGEYTVVYLDLEGEGPSRSAEEAVRGIRDLPAPANTWVTGQAASQVDFRDIIVGSLPKVVTVVGLATFVLLLLMTGSVLVPLKALIINILSLAASIGVLVWVFQEGHLTGLLGFTPIGGIEAYVVVTAVAVGFGLAMDYEVFLLGRIKEYWDQGHDNDSAVERGLQRSGRIVTSAALIMVTVFLGFISGELLVVKQVGLALAVVVALDATVVRMLLVPATMTLLGRWNWWAPGPLRRFHERYGLRDEA